MKTLFASISENVQFVLLCLAVTAAVVLLAWGGERLVMKKRHRLNTAHTITTVGMLAAISGVLMVIELPLFFAPPFYKLDFSELPVLICAFSLGPVAGVVCEFLKVLIKLLLKGTSVGACTAASIMVGKQIGSGGKQLRTMVYTMQLLFVGLGAALGIVLFFLRIPLLRVYRISDETRYLANAFFLIQSVVLLTMSYQMPTNAGILRGGGDTRFALVLDLISFWAIVIPLSYLAAFRWHASPIVVVMLLNSDQVFKCIPAFLRVNHFRWVHSLTREA